MGHCHAHAPAHAPCHARPHTGANVAAAAAAMRMNRARQAAAQHHSQTSSSHHHSSAHTSNYKPTMFAAAPQAVPVKPPAVDHSNDAMNKDWEEDAITLPSPK